MRLQSPVNILNRVNKLCNIPKLLGLFQFPSTGHHCNRIHRRCSNLRMSSASSTSPVPQLISSRRSPVQGSIRGQEEEVMVPRKVNVNVEHQEARTSKTYLFWFSNEHSNFRMAELEALFRIFCLDPGVLDRRKTFGPFILLDFPDEVPVKQLLSRSVLAHSALELWANGETLSDVHFQIQRNDQEFGITLPFQTNSFRIRVDTYGKTMTMEKKLDLIDTFDYLPFEGRVDLRNPECSLHLIQYYGMDSNNVPEEPYQVFFGRWIGEGQRRLMYKLSLKERKFIGNTSMDPLLSLVMANLALVDHGTFVLDPFVGSGSLLVAAAVFGGYVTGTDIDYLMIHARTRPSRASQTVRSEDESIRANLEQYEVQSNYMDVLCADASRSLWRHDVRFDAIITDPPYGVREPTEKIGSKRNNVIKDEHIALHIPCKVDYSLVDIFCDLINFGARTLNIGSRLVFWLPVLRLSYDDSFLPNHRSFRLVANIEQSLTAIASRRLIVFEKVSEPEETSKTAMDSSAPMYRFKFFDAEFSRSRKERKAKSAALFGSRSKRGQFLK